MRISDWSSDVCASDLVDEQQVEGLVVAPHVGHRDAVRPQRAIDLGFDLEALERARPAAQPPPRLEEELMVAARSAHVDEPAEAPAGRALARRGDLRSDGHTSELQSLMPTSYAVF